MVSVGALAQCKRRRPPCDRRSHLRSPPGTGNILTRHSRQAQCFCRLLTTGLEASRRIQRGSQARAQRPPRGSSARIPTATTAQAGVVSVLILSPLSLKRCASGPLPELSGASHGPWAANVACRAPFAISERAYGCVRASKVIRSFEQWEPRTTVIQTGRSVCLSCGVLHAALASRRREMPCRVDTEPSMAGALEAFSPDSFLASRACWPSMHPAVHTTLCRKHRNKRASSL